LASRWPETVVEGIPPGMVGALRLLNEGTAWTVVVAWAALGVT
jgi:hypothetical protein